MSDLNIQPDYGIVLITSVIVVLIPLILVHMYVTKKYGEAKKHSIEGKIRYWTGYVGWMWFGYAVSSNIGQFVASRLTSYSKFNADKAPIEIIAGLFVLLFTFFISYVLIKIINLKNKTWQHNGDDVKVIRTSNIINSYIPVVVIVLLAYFAFMYNKESEILVKNAVTNIAQIQTDAPIKKDRTTKYCEVYWNGWKLELRNGIKLPNYTEYDIARYGVIIAKLSIPNEMEKALDVYGVNASSIDTEKGKFAEFLGTNYSQIENLCAPK